MTRPTRSYTARPHPARAGRVADPLSTREGTALITLEDTVPPTSEKRPQSRTYDFRGKGLDFHSVRVLDAGRHIERIQRQGWREWADSDIEDLQKCLAIDQLRVAVSRPAERLIWLDVDPTDQLPPEYRVSQWRAGGKRRVILVSRSAA